MLLTASVSSSIHHGLAHRTHLTPITQLFGSWCGIYPTFQKLTFFIWIIMHHKLLMGENLVKRGFFGPFQCCFCHQVVESTAHIFVDCVFAQKVWELVVSGMPYSFDPVNAEPVMLFKNWK